jgi:hypothetical protein
MALAVVTRAAAGRPFRSAERGVARADRAEFLLVAVRERSAASARLMPGRIGLPHARMIITSKKSGDRRHRRCYGRISWLRRQL